MIDIMFDLSYNANIPLVLYTLFSIIIYTKLDSVLW